MKHPDARSGIEFLHQDVNTNVPADINYTINFQTAFPSNAKIHLMFGIFSYRMNNKFFTEEIDMGLT